MVETFRTWFRGNSHYLNNRNSDISGITTQTIIRIVSLVLLIIGFESIAQGARVKEIPGWSRCILLGVGGLNIFVSILAIIAPNYGESTLARSISITLLITGIQMITSTIGIKKKYSKSQVSTR